MESLASAADPSIDDAFARALEGFSLESGEISSLQRSGLGRLVGSRDPYSTSTKRKRRRTGASCSSGSQNCALALALVNVLRTLMPRSEEWLPGFLWLNPANPRAAMAEQVLVMAWERRRCLTIT